MPAHFRFAVKLPRTITHDGRLIEIAEPLARFVEEVGGLSDRRGPALIQLPPSLAFDPAVAGRALQRIAGDLGGEIACEPRHPSWFTAEAEALLVHHRIARVAADPARITEAADPGGWPGLAYFRLHGSPETYRTPYGPDRVAVQAGMLAELTSRKIASWTIYDNTQSGAATGDALMLHDTVARSA